MELDSRAIMARTHELPDGERVRLRLARARDEAPLRALFGRRRGNHDASHARALTRFDPRHQVVVCAVALGDSSQELVGVGAVDLDGARPPEVVIDQGQHRELANLLRRALAARVSARRRR